ncbi:MAG TPA: ABC transporter transmembrane domain-containing protein, partial [Chitinophagaceae bacterium]|nr:ABC transporter transmembrane domain-containing protein [Chitinophagaceae bacterium]
MFKHLKALNKYFVKYKWRVILGIIFIVCSNLMAVIPAQVVGYILDFVKNNVKQVGERIIPDQNWFLHLTFDWINNDTLITVVAYGGAVLLALALLKGFFMFLMREMINVMSRYIEVDLKEEIYSHYQKLDYNFFKTHNTGDLMNRIATDVSRVRYYVGPSLMYSTNLIVLITVT